MRLHKSEVSKLPEGSFYVVLRGYIWNDWQTAPTDSYLDVKIRLRGGKGGFGSQLRSSGSQYSKSQNTDSCRDLSGRRLRDVDEERKLKKWVEKAADRAREKADRKRHRLEKLAKGPPKQAFEDETYSDDKKTILEENANAVDDGMKAALDESMPSTSGIGADPFLKASRKRKAEEPQPEIRGSKAMFWTGVDEDDLSDSDTESSDEGSPGTSAGDESSLSGPSTDGASTSLAEIVGDAEAEPTAEKDVPAKSSCPPSDDAV